MTAAIVSPLTPSLLPPLPSLPPLPALVVRDAIAADNAALLEIAASCPMEGAITLCVDRAPDFFALDRLGGDAWRVGVVDRTPGAPIGCIAATARASYLRGAPARTGYVGDLKVVPGCRGHRAADSLSVYARDACRELAGEDAPILVTILDGNEAMDRRTSGPRGLPVLDRFATIRSHSIPLLRQIIPAAPSGIAVCEARDDSLDEMVALWSRVSPGRQLAPVLTPEALAAWIDTAPGLHRSSYLLARDRAGRLLGFVGIWDQRSFKQLRVIRYSPRLAAVRRVFNAAARLAGATPLPAAGEQLAVATAVQLCVPSDRPEVLRALLTHASRQLAARRFSCFNVGLDVRDPLTIALRGLWAQGTDVGAYITGPTGRYTGPSLDDRPLHHEIALV